MLLPPGIRLRTSPVARTKNAASGDAGTEDSGGTNLNEQAFKGLQRRLTAKDRENKELQSRVSELQTQNQSGGLSTEAMLALVRPLIAKINEHDPDSARALATQIAAGLTARQNQQLQEQVNAQANRQKQEQEESETLNDLRALATDLGVDPDSQLVDYGDTSMSLRDRMAIVRETAKDALKPAKPTAPKPTVSNGGAANPNPGAPPSPRPQSKVYSREDYGKALAAYRASPTKENMARAKEIKEALVTSLEATLPNSIG